VVWAKSTTLFQSEKGLQTNRIAPYRGITAGRAYAVCLRGWVIAGFGNSFIAMRVERHTRFVMLAKVDNKDSHSFIQALIKQSRKLPKELYRSLTWDRRCEMAGHKAFTLASEIDVFLCDPQVIPPFLTGCGCRTYAAIFSFMAGVMPPMPIFGRSVARQWFVCKP
jgi:hypothetical protein